MLTQKVKRERGESCFAPHRLPFGYEPLLAVANHALCSSRQDLAALGTTTGQNLAAVGSSHSLPETVNLGSLATAGLVGTLHSVHLLSVSLCSTAEKRPQQHIVRDYKKSH